MEPACFGSGSPLLSKILIMKYFINTFVLLLYAMGNIFAQQQGSIWTFGQAHAVTFTNAGPVYGGVPGVNVNNSGNMPFFRSNAVCDAAGNLLFFVKIKSTEFTVPPDNPDYLGKNIYDANGNAMANSNLVFAAATRGPVHIIKKPGADKKYYVIYSLNQALLSTTVDMDMNGGQGGVVAGEKGVLLSGWQTIVGEKTAVIQGCDCIWLVVRSRNNNQYKSYRITENGIGMNPVISTVGLLPLNNYNVIQTPGPYGVAGMSLDYKNGNAGLLKVSPDGKSVVACCDKGLELYDFHKCDGSLSDARLIDTATTQLAPIYSPFSGLHDNPWPVGFYSACFSPDNSKLYATYMFSRHVYQYDLTLPTVQAIRSSKTIVLSNDYSVHMELAVCGVIDTPAMGDLKLAPDGKIYIGNAGYGVCDTTLYPNANKYYALHAINNPNLQGTACNSQHNAFMISYLYAPNAAVIGVDFPPDMVLPPQKRDTLYSLTNIRLCRNQLLIADTSGDCYLWNTGQQSAGILIDTSGLYIVRWSGADCAFHIDSFSVWVTPFPQVDSVQKGCPGEMSIHVSQKAGDTTTYNYTLKSNDNNTLRVTQSNNGYHFNQLDQGLYTLSIATLSGCDTIIPVLLEALPKPIVRTSPADTTIKYGDTIRLQASGALHYVWSPPAHLDSSYIAMPLAFPAQPTLYAVMGLAENGCRDTGFIKVNIDYTMKDFIPNAFSPNGDGLNDGFGVKGLRFQKLLQFQVFNRYGQQIFSTLDPAGEWDGTFHEKPCDPGSYYYYIKLAYPDGKIKTCKGDVALIR